MTKEEFKSKFKNGIDKIVNSSKAAFGKAGNAVQDFSDKSVIRIEKKQYESKRNEQYEKFGKLVFDKLKDDAKAKLDFSAEEFSKIIDEIKRLNDEIKKREESLANEDEVKKETENENGQ